MNRNWLISRPSSLDEFLNQPPEHHGDFLPPFLREFTKKSTPFSRENNILPPYVRTIFKKFTLLKKMTPFKGILRDWKSGTSMRQPGLLEWRGDIACVGFVICNGSDENKPSGDLIHKVIQKGRNADGLMPRPINPIGA
jgi:hypothetical protein